jgi:hypothetical protein
MKEAIEPVYLYLPLMKGLGMSWETLKRTPRWELEGLLFALSEYNVLHSMDGYTDRQVGQIAKDSPEIRSQWNAYQEKKAKYDKRAGVTRKPQSFKDLVK